MKSWIVIPMMLAALGAGDSAPTTQPATAPSAVAADMESVDAAPGTQPATAPSADAESVDSPATAPAAVAGATQPAAPTAAAPPTTQPLRLATSSPTTQPVRGALPARGRFAANDSSQRTSRRGGSSFGGRTYVAPTVHTLLPKEYSILNERSIFLKGHVTQFALDELRPPSVGDVGPRVRGGDDRLPPPAPVLSAPEESLVFDGVTQADQHIVAFVEDRNAFKVSMVKVGDLIARGRITAIDLDTMDYYANGNVVHVLIGENLLGTPVSMADASTGTPTTGPTTAPSGDSGAPAAGGNDILERLRRRRAQELGGN